MQHLSEFSFIRKLAGWIFLDFGDADTVLLETLIVALISPPSGFFM